MSKMSRLKPSNDSLHRDLMLWAKEEMIYHTTSHSSSHNFKFPTEQDFKLLFQKPLDDVWRYVLKHVKSVQTVKHVKGNIAIKRNIEAQKCLKPQTEARKEKDELEEKSKRRANLMKDLTSYKSDISYLHKEMNQISKDVMETELNYQRVTQHIRDLQRKESFLEVVAASSDSRIAQYSNCTKIINDHLLELKKTSNSSSENFVMGGRSLGIKENILETKRDRDVRHTCEHISKFLRDMFNTNLMDKDVLNNAETQLWKIVESTALLYGSKDILTSLINLTMQAAKNIKEEAISLDIVKDALALSFTYEEGSGLHDISQPITAEKTVKQLLDASNLRHVLRWFKEQEHRNDEWKLTARLEDILMEIHKHVYRIMEEHPRNIHLARGYIDALIQLAIERCVLPCVREETSRIIDAIELAKEEKDELHHKFERIQDFKKIVEKKQSIIAALAKQNSSAPERLSSQKVKVISFVRSKSLEAQVTETKLVTTGLHGNLLSELEHFSSVPLLCMLVVTVDSVLDMSIAPTMYYILQEKPWIYSDLCAAFGMPHFQSSESLPLQLLELQNSFHDLIHCQQHRELRIKSTCWNDKTFNDFQYFIAFVKKHCTDLCIKIEQFDKAQCSKYLPSLKKRLELLDSSMAKFNQIKSHIHSWWEQPAKFTTPWILQEGKTFEQWMQKWRVLVTEIHKKMESRNLSA